jgi:hypothetical protein
MRIMPYLGSVVKLSIVRGRTSINWPSSTTVMKCGMFKNLRCGVGGNEVLEMA